MAENRPEDLPLHDEAAARAKWRGGETIVGKRGKESLPASVDDADAGGDGDGAVPRVDLRPPD
jgi:hypothetical protein